MDDPLVPSNPFGFATTRRGWFQHDRWDNPDDASGAWLGCTECGSQEAEVVQVELRCTPEAGQGPVGLAAVVAPGG